MTGQQGYPYRALQPNTIRLLRVYQGAVNNLVCDLEVAHIDRLPSYEALSYCWGDPSEKIPIECNASGGLAITKNLHSALHCLRLSNQPRLIWADAICINQEDIEERSSQVRLMKDIYQRASSVVVWLGEPIEVDGKDLWPIPPLLEAAQKNLKRTQLPIRHGTKDWVRHVLRPDYTTNGDLEDKRWNAIIKSLILLLHRPWFLRTWIIQEVGLATHAIVICGSHSASWEDFYRAVSYAIDLDYFSATLPEMYSSMQNIERARRDLARQQYLRPLDLYASFRVFLATDPRDKVFGLYSLFSPSDLAVVELQPDYNLDLTTVYTQATIDCIATEGNLDVLSFGGQDCLVAHHQLPTWVPDWAYQDRTKPLLPRFLSTLSFGEHQWARTWQSATGTSYPVVELSENKKCIMLSGYVLDRVLDTGGTLEKEYYTSTPGHPLLEINIVMKKCSDVFEKWEDICGVSASIPYFTGEAAWDVYWKTLHAGGYPHGDEQTTKATFSKWYQPFRDLRSNTEYTANRIEEIKNSDSSTAYKIAAGVGWFGKVTYNAMRFGMGLVMNKNKFPPSKILAFHRTLFKTERGLVGLSSRHVRKGDAIALFKGGKMPMVLREAGDGDWRVVGDSYVHGIMNGEEFDRSRCDALRIG
ncbi:Heterokaryon incompatibility protein 6,OR allele [Lachnellula hyalina]|uniref:Heterokaryon incompatibility protein 6,OR allele n=1 Tax=Lachnellula hyalina TaxID=1316788 RepID=A0A8H8QU31_9HELO|nr:Heterokaryon incompatibility protein 6,OR allele [Lachnellula hyalina]TVY22146.1 Heterokaryon incompatibility protein 6,OR allele [Lachnellula hyalina]